MKYYATIDQQWVKIANVSELYYRGCVYQSGADTKPIHTTQWDRDHGFISQLVTIAIDKIRGK